MKIWKLWRKLNQAMSLSWLLMIISIRSNHYKLTFQTNIIPVRLRLFLFIACFCFLFQAYKTSILSSGRVGKRLTNWSCQMLDVFDFGWFHSLLPVMNFITMTFDEVKCTNASSEKVKLLSDFFSVTNLVQIRVIYVRIT